jgi:hypothetical protein
MFVCCVLRLFQGGLNFQYNVYVLIIKKKKEKSESKQGCQLLLLLFNTVLMGVQMK